jgi:hypothetical protein
MSETTDNSFSSDIENLEGTSQRTRRWVLLAVILSIIAIVLALLLRGCDLSSQPTAAPTCPITTATPGDAGADGAIGATGISAYELWLKLGNTGDEQAFLDSLIGVAGDGGYIGETGLSGPEGTVGPNGSTGKSAYELWIAAGNTGTSQDFLTSLLGANGASGAAGLSAYQLWLSLGHVGTETDFINSLIGIQGIAGVDGVCLNGTDGTNGIDGVNGLSAYQVWVLNGHTGETQAAFLASLVGAAGTNGTNGAPGVTGPAGPAGPQGIQGPAGLSGLGSSASFFSTVDQGPFAANTIQAFTLNQTDWQTGIVLQSGSQIKMLNAGKYNIEFSVQLHQLNSSGVVNIWLAKNGVAMPDTNTKMDITSNNPYYVAAWNFFVNANANDYYEIVWSSSDNHTVAENEPAGAHPAVPSIIVTVDQVG